MNKNIIIVGFMLFAMFFGAGNLIFPPRLGLESQSDYLYAILGFISTGVGLPLLGIIVSSFYQGGYQKALNKINPYFSVIFLSAIYLSVGPFFAIPRTGATSYELAIQPFLSHSNITTQLIFSAIYFLLSLWLALNPSKMVERIGAILTPLLLLSILILVLSTLFQPNQETITYINNENNVFFKGFVDGYLTMDALASIAYSSIVILAIQSKGINKHNLSKQTSIAALIAASALALIYLALAWIGNNSQISPHELHLLAEKNQDVGTYILNVIANRSLGHIGSIMLGIIVSLACLTTAIGLIVSVSEYFNSIYHKISYKGYACIFTLISFIIANQGLNFVISKSVPVLSILYPISITIIFILLLNIFIPVPLLAQRIAIICVTIISLLSLTNLAWINSLPLKPYFMQWLPFALIGLVLGWGIDIIKQKSIKNIVD